MDVSLNALSYHYIPIDAPPPPEAVLDDFLLFSHSLGVRGVDLEDRLFASTSSAYLCRVCDRAASLGLKLLSVGVKVDFGAEVTREYIEAEVARAKGWIDVASALGAPLLRLAGNGINSAPNLGVVWKLITEKFSQLVAYGLSFGVHVGLHNHNHGPSTWPWYTTDGALPATAAQIHQLLNAVRGLKLILDVGQFPSVSVGSIGDKDEPQPATDEVYENIRGLAARAHTIRAKFYMLDQENGDEQLLDYARIFVSLREAGFTGWLSIVYEGTTLAEHGRGRAPTPVKIALPVAVARLRRGLAQSAPAKL